MADPVVFNEFLAQQGQGFDFLAAVVKGVVFLKGAWTPDPDDTYLVEATVAGAVEAAPSMNRVTYGSKAVSRDDVNDRGVWTAASVFYIGVPIGTQYDTFVTYNFGTDDTDSWMITAYDLGGPYTSDGGQLTFALDPVGLFAFQQA